MMWLAFAAISVLSACESTTTTPETTGASAANDAVDARSAAPADQRPGGDGQPAADGAPAVAALTGPAEPEVESDPERLVGMDRGALRDLLGAPAFIRKDAPAQLWRYRHATCSLDLFLYDQQDPSRPRYTVKHYAVRGTADTTVTPDACLKGLLIARMSKPTG